MIAPPLKADPPQSHPPQRVWLWIALSLAWCACAIPGWGALLQHAYQPAATEEGVAGWPAGAHPQPPWSGCRVVVFAHPFCPCTRATLNKLNESLRRIPGATFVQVVFVTAGLSAADVSESPLLATARRLSGVDVQLDETGNEAQRFGAKISGEVLAFDGRGRRLFHGGLTSARGHEGESASQQQLERILCGTSGESYTAPVYGCSLPGGRSAAAGAPSKVNVRDPQSTDDRRSPVTARSLEK
jgi:hypothetical protein